MFYTLPENKKVYVEITNPIHGGPGWDFGQCLWSPSKNKAGGDSWSLMREIKPGDLIIHMLKNDSDEYSFVGVSLASSSCITVNSEPPQPDRWGGMKPYYRINLNNYMVFSRKIGVSEFFTKYKADLHGISSSFYVEYGSTGELRMAQKYIALAPDKVFDLINELFTNEGFVFKTLDESISITDNEPCQSDIGTPNTVEVYITRRIRDTELVRSLKKDHDYICQICGKSIKLPNEQYYAEGHHLQPLGGANNGPDIKSNIIIVCPYHHAEFDYGSIAINPVNNLICHIDDTNEFNGRPLNYSRADLDTKYIEYHYNTLYNKKK